MPRIDFVLAWKDSDFRDGLTPEERDALPECPIGYLDLVPGESVESGRAVLRIKGFEPVQFSLWSFLANCENISNAMSSTSTCCCYSIPTDPS